MDKKDDILSLTNFVTTTGTKNSNSALGNAFNTKGKSNTGKNIPKFKEGDKVYYITKAKVMKVFQHPNEEPYYLVKLKDKREINTIGERLIIRKSSTITCSN